MKHTGSIELSIVMPCLNEAETIETCIIKAKEFLAKSSINGEIVIGDNGSTDGSQQIAEKCGARVVHIAIKGYGNASAGVIKAAKGKHVIIGDSDDSYDFSNLAPFVERLNEGYDLVIGNRFKGNIHHTAMPFLNKYLGNPILSFIGRLFIRSHIGDFHCGLRGFRQDIVDVLQLQTPGMEFASEMIVKATLHKFKITEVPVTLSPDGRTRPSHLRPWKDGWRHLRFLLRYSPSPSFLFSELLLMIGGLVQRFVRYLEK
jgi:glycosyltransferase involved in cell wall biosynthesis